MIAWKRICCAVDFGEASRFAMEQAADLALRLDAELTLVHVVVPLPATTDALVLVSSQELTEAQAREEEKTLAVWGAEAQRRVGRPVHSRALSGDPAAELVRYAREARIDVMVVGTHGRTGLPRLVLGSVAERVARQAPCPVLVVHDREELARARVAEEVAQYR